MAHNETVSVNNKKKWAIILSSLFLIGSLILATYIMINTYDPDSDSENDEFLRTDVTVEFAYQMTLNSSGFPDLIILDVRTQSEYDAGHLSNSILMPVAEIEENIEDLLPYQNRTILVHCQSGSRSLTASNILISYHFSRIYNMLGGYSDWVASGYPTVV